MQQTPLTGPDYHKILELMEEGFAYCELVYNATKKPVDFRYIQLNAAFGKQIGRSADEIIGRTASELIPEVAADWSVICSEAIRSGKSKRFESALASLGQTYEVHVWPVTAKRFAHIITKAPPASGELEAINEEIRESRLALMNVMDDLEEAKATIEVEKAKDEAMLNSIGDGLVAVDNNRKIIVMNKAAEDMLGRKTSQVIGQDITSLPLEDDKGNLLPLDERPTYSAMGSGKPAAASLFFVKNDGSRLPIAINVTPIKLGRKVIGAINIFRDVTQERAIDKAKSEFVSLASHQLRTPLGIVKWYLEALKEQDYIKHMPAQTKDYFHEIYKNNERVLNLVRNLLSISRIDQGKVKDAPKLTSVTGLVRDIIKDMSVVARRKKIQLELIVHSDNLPAVVIDPLRLHEVVENLIANAIEYNKPAGRVSVVVDKSPQASFVISVMDTGIGISKKDQQRLFTKFYRSERAARNNVQGTGLGLYLVKSYVEEWGGRVSVQSRETRGSTFSVTLPLKPKSAG